MIMGPVRSFTASSAMFVDRAFWSMEYVKTELMAQHVYYRTTCYRTSTASLKASAGEGLLIAVHQANAGDFTYINYGTLDKPDELPPKGEFFCKVRAKWLPEIPGESGLHSLFRPSRFWWLAKFSLRISDIFHKQEIKT